MDISFSCNKCGQHIAIDEAGSGQLVDCPNCGISLEVPYKSRPANEPALPLQAVTTPPAPAQPPVPFKRNHQRRAIAACAIVATAIAVIFLLFVGVRQYEKIRAAATAAEKQAAAEKLALEQELRRQQEAAQEATRSEEMERLAKAEEAQKAQEAKRVEEKERLAKAEEAQKAQEAKQKSEAKIHELTAWCRQLLEQEHGLPPPVRRRIEAAIQEYEAEVHSPEARMQARKLYGAHYDKWSAEEGIEPDAWAVVGWKYEWLVAAVEHPTNDIRIAHWSWTTDDLGMTMTASFVIENRSASDIKDIEITCHHFAPSGTEIDSNKRTIYEIIRAGRSLSVTNFNMGFIHSQVKSSSAVITDFTPVR